MASYTDRTTNFDPYISQLPIIEEMSKVGMEKQALYNQGVQKIQGQIDNIAGLDVIRDVDKNYLQSKLNALGNNLRTVAAGDFSNFQLVNSVGGMTNQIAKDANIQNAIYSAQVVRKGQQDLQAAKTAGKSSVQNEDWWNQQVGAWTSNKDIKTKFNGTYVPYTDLTEKYAKVRADLKDTERSYDQPYRTNADGSLKYFTQDKKGNMVETEKGKGIPLPDDTMKSISVKGVSAKTILNNFYDNTTENDKQQLQIDAAYHYKGATANTFKNDIVANFTLEKKQLNEYATELAVALKSPQLPDSEKSKLEAKLNDVNTKLSDGSIDAELARSLKELQNPANLASYKTKLYTQKYLSNLAQDQSTESYKEELKASPIFQANMEKKKLAFDVQKENTRIQQWNATYKLDVLKFTTSEEDKKLAKEEKRLEKLGSEPVTSPGGKSTDVKTPTATTISDKINVTNTELKMLDNDYISTYKDKDGKGVTKEQLDAYADKFDMDQGISLKDNDIRDYILQRRQLEHNNIRNGSLLKGIQEATAGIESQIVSTLKGQPGITDSTGREIYTAEEMYTVNNKLRNFLSYVPGTAKSWKFNKEEALKQYAGTKYEPMARAIIKKMQTTSNPFADNEPQTEVERSINNKVNTLVRQVNPSISKLVEAKTIKESEYLADKTPDAFPTNGTLSKDNETDMDHVAQLISESMNPDTEIIDVTKKSDWSGKKVTEWRDKEAIAKNLDYRLRINPDGTGKLIVAHGTEEYTIPLTARAFAAYFPRYAEKSPVDNIKKLIIGSVNGTTNINKKGDAVNSEYTGYTLPLLKDTNYASKVRYDVEGRKSITGGKYDGYQVRVYVYDDKEKIWKNSVINQRGYIGEDSVMDAINSIGMNIVESILKQ